MLCHTIRKQQLTLCGKFSQLLLGHIASIDCCALKTLLSTQSTDQSLNVENEYA